MAANTAKVAMGAATLCRTLHHFCLTAVTVLHVPPQAAIAARAASLSAPAWLFVDILNAYAMHHAAGNPNITPGVLQVWRSSPIRNLEPGVSILYHIWLRRTGRHQAAWQACHVTPSLGA